MKIAIIGSGFAGLSSACDLASKGYDVTVFEKNSTTGGRARHFSKDGFLFDMGPSWYWMPEIFEEFFNRFGKSTKDYYNLVRLDPSYQVFFEDKSSLKVAANLDSLKLQLEEIEKGSAAKLDKFLEEAKIKYDTGMKEFVWKPSLSVMEFADARLIRESVRLQLFTSMSAHLRRFFSNPKILQLLEFPVLFLGAKPAKTPALYSMMNYADIVLGTWYPIGGMYKITEAMTQLTQELGVTIETNATVDRIITSKGEATGLLVNGEVRLFDAIIGAADYHHIESKLLQPNEQSYNTEYWNKRVMSPSCLLFYVAVNRKVKNLLHHNLFFDEDFQQHADDIYDNAKWPEKPLFYVCAPSVTDPSVAPAGKENLFILFPVAPDLSSNENQREAYFQMALRRIAEHTGEDISNDILFRQSYAHEEFISDYNSFKGNAYGLANTLTQTAFLKPKLRSKKIKNLFYAGQLTVPGPGVPPSIISGQVAAQTLHQYLATKQAVAL